jgi:type IV pilus biogenesis protein CpaD/CtpE
MPHVPHQISLFLGLLLLSTGCTSTDPYEREGVWHPQGSNEANLRAMVAIPADLAQGVGDGHGNSQQAEAAIERLRTDKVKALPASGIAEFNTNSSGAGASGGAGAALTGGQ